MLTTRDFQVLKQFRSLDSGGSAWCGFSLKENTDQPLGKYPQAKCFATGRGFLTWHFAKLACYPFTYIWICGSTCFSFLNEKGAGSCSLMMVKTKKVNRTPHLRKCYERQGRPNQEKASLNLVPWMLPCPPPDPKGREGYRGVVVVGLKLSASIWLLRRGCEPQVERSSHQPYLKDKKEEKRSLGCKQP